MEEEKEERQAVMAIAAILIITIFAAMFLQQIEDLFSPKVPPEQTIGYCENHGAKYTSFTNSCRDSCAPIQNGDYPCNQVLTTGCDCGPENCWNGIECISNQKAATSSP